MLIRQGDVLLIPCNPEDVWGNPVAPDPQRGFVLMEGEATGHAHTIVAESGVELVTAEEAEELRMWLLLEVEAELTHPEHKPLLVPPGTYEVRRQREYDPQAIRMVSD